MLLIRGIYLLLLHLPTSHTTVHAVQHTEVSDFLISRCVASYFKLSLCVRPLLFYCRIPSYCTNREFLSDIWLQTKSQGSNHLLLHCPILSFPIGTRALGTMASADLSRQVLLHELRKRNKSSCP